MPFALLDRPVMIPGDRELRFAPCPPVISFSEEFVSLLTDDLPVLTPARSEGD